jgi:hypothetical protein
MADLDLVADATVASQECFGERDLRVRVMLSVSHKRQRECLVERALRYPTSAQPRHRSSHGGPHLVTVLGRVDKGRTLGRV